jgi:hypothetical protein
MSFTGTHHAYCDVHEDGINTALRLFLTARPHYLHFGSPPFVLADSLNATLVAAIAIPGTPGGLPWDVQFAPPIVDLYPENGPPPPPVGLAINQALVSTTANITVGCVEPTGAITPQVTTLRAAAIVSPAEANGFLSLNVDKVLLPDVKPDSLRDILACLIAMAMRGVLAQFRVSIQMISAGFFKLTLENGPNILDNRIEVLGDIS